MTSLQHLLCFFAGTLLGLSPASAWAAGGSGGEPVAEVTDAVPKTPPALRLLGLASLSSYDGSSWLGGSLGCEGRVHGAVWFIGTIGLERRPEVQVTTSAGRFTLPTQFGFRRIARLPGGIELRGGGDFLVVFENALTEGTDERTIAPRPGGLLELGMTLPLANRLDFDLSLGMGAVIREQPSDVADLPPLIGPDPRFQLRMGLRLHLGAPRSLLTN